MFPFYMVVLNSFKSKRDIVKTPLAWGGKRGFTLDNYAEAFQKMNFLHVLGNSFIVTCTSVALIILFSSMCAYIFVRRNWKINKILYALMLFSMVIPFQVVMIPLISIYGGMFGMLNHRPTLIFMHVGFSMAMAVFMYYGFIRGSIPISLEEAAEIDGANLIQTIFKIKIPLLKPYIWLCTLNSVISAIAVFDVVFVLTKGGPNNATMVINYYSYTKAFGDFQFGYAAAIGAIQGVLTTLLSIAVFVYGRRGGMTNND